MNVGLYRLYHFPNIFHHFCLMLSSCVAEQISPCLEWVAELPISDW